MTDARFITGPRKSLLYLRIALHVAGRYARQPRRFGYSPAAYLRFLARALRLLLVFRHHKVVRVSTGYKLHLYLPAYPSPAFFHTLESKLLRAMPGASTVVFSMTKACAYRCEHCYQRRDGGPDLDEALLLDTARKAVDAGVAMFDIEGGEPFLRFPRLLALARALDARCEIWVNTSGDGVTPELLTELRAAGVFGIFVSIHSPDAAVHDALTGVPGSFAVACEAARMARRAGLAVSLNSVLSEEELRDEGLPRLMELAKELDADFVQLIHPKPAGMWLGRTEGMQRDEALLAYVRREHLRYNSSARRAYPMLAAQAFEETSGVLGCTAGGVDRFYVNANGEVQPCEFLNISFGNVREEPFATIFARMRAFFPIPCADWLCCTQGAAIDELLRRHEASQTPVPWPLTRELVEGWDRGTPTPLYRKLGIYR